MKPWGWFKAPEAELLFLRPLDLKKKKKKSIQHKPAAFSCFGYLYKHFPIQIAYSNQISLVYAFFSNYLKAFYLSLEEHSRKAYRQNLVDSGRDKRAPGLALHKSLCPRKGTLMGLLDGFQPCWYGNIFLGGKQSHRNWRRGAGLGRSGGRSLSLHGVAFVVGKQLTT